MLLYRYSALVICILLMGCASKFAKIQKSKDYEYKYKMADEYYNAKKYSNAQLIFEEITPFIRGTSKYEDLFYKLAYSYYYQQDYINAENLFKVFTETFPSSNRTEECEYMRAYSFFKQSPKVELDQTNTTKAVGLLQAFISIHPSSSRVKEANQLIDLCREKLELKEFKAAQLYYNLAYYKAAGISFTTLLENYPDTKNGDSYKLQAINAYYKYAELSIEEKQNERFEKVVSECTDFKERFPDSKLLESVKNIKIQCLTNIKNLKDLKYEQNKKTN